MLWKIVRACIFKIIRQFQNTNTRSEQFCKIVLRINLIQGSYLKTLIKDKVIALMNHFILDDGKIKLRW